MDRILLLMAAEDYAEARRALESARANAAAGERISYGLSLAAEPEQEDHAAMRALGSVQFLCPGYDSWQDAETLWQGEGFVLVAHPFMRFEKNWDMHLLHALNMCRPGGTFSAALTGYLPRPQDPVDAVCPVAAQAFDSEGQLCFHRGTPLRYAKAPVRSAFLHPYFCFAPSAFFRDIAAEERPRFLAAFRRKWELYTLHKPVIHMMGDAPVAPCTITPEDGPLSRFETRFSLKFATHQLSAMARQGIFTADLSYPMHVPYAVRAQEALRDALGRRSKVNPLCVTAWVACREVPANLPEQYLGWFGNLARLKNLALLCFGDGDTARRVSLRHPNVLEYKPRYGLQAEGVGPYRQSSGYVRLSKALLLAQAREKFLNHSHYIWMDFGYQRYPVYERTAFDWENICLDQITLARVDGKLDLSMIVVPDERVLTLCREITALCESCLQRESRLMDEDEVWAQMLDEHPDWFALVDLPGRRELITMTMMSREEEAHAYT